MLFPPGDQVSYSNGGMIVAGRLLEVVTGVPYHELLERDIFAAAGMTGSCTSAERAILRSTAVGHFAGPATGTVRPTGMFTLPQTWGPAGGTPIGTVEDLLVFGRAHLGAGLLTAEPVERMRPSPTTRARRARRRSASAGWCARSAAPPCCR